MDLGSQLPLELPPSGWHNAGGAAAIVPVCLLCVVPASTATHKIFRSHVTPARPALGPPVPHGGAVRVRRKQARGGFAGHTSASPSRHRAHPCNASSAGSCDTTRRVDGALRPRRTSRVAPRLRAGSSPPRGWASGTVATCTGWDAPSTARTARLRGHQRTRDGWIKRLGRS